MLLHTHTVMSFILGLTATGMFMHLKQLKQPVNARKWLMGFYLGLIIWQIENMVRYSAPVEYFDTLPYKLQTVLVLIPMLALAHISHSQYAYKFLEATHEKERRIFLRVSYVLSLAEFLFVCWNEFINKGGMAITLLSAFFYSSLYTFWIIILCLRKAKRLRPTNFRASNAHYIYAAINGCYVAAAIFSLLFGFFSVPGFWSYFLFVWLGNLAAIVLYIVSAAVPASFQTKITGFTYVLAASFLTIVTLTFYPPVFLTDLPARVAQQGGLTRLIIIITIMVLMIVTLMPFMLRISLTNRLNRLLLGVQRVNSGKLDTQVNEGLQDEIGMLTKNFNQMTMNLRKAQQDLTDYAQTLEKKVNLRTAQLQTSLTELKALQAQLIQAEKIASLGELTAGIAHEIKNPLNFINNFSEVSIELCDELNEEIKHNEPNLEDVRAIVDDLTINLERIHHHGQRADSIVQGMLEHSRTSKGESQETDINALTEENLQECYNNLLKKNKITPAYLETNYDEKLSMDSAGKGKINIIKQDVGRALSNLFSNAFYSITEKKNLSARTYQPTVTVTTHFLNASGNGHAEMLEIRVRDNGVGIPPANIDKIFQPFFTTKPTGEGTGLGLSLTYDIIKAHGGDLKVDTKEGEYAEFIVNLPV
jgi:two-component system NtrC family sensor kinase